MHCSCVAVTSKLENETRAALIRHKVSTVVLLQRCLTISFTANQDYLLTNICTGSYLGARPGCIKEESPREHIYSSLKGPEQVVIETEQIGPTVNQVNNN